MYYSAPLWFEAHSGYVWVGVGIDLIVYASVVSALCMPVLCLQRYSLKPVVVVSGRRLRGVSEI